MTLIRTATGNSRYQPKRYKCPFCDHTLSISKPHFMTQCSKCNKLIKEDELIKIKKED